MPRFDWWLGIDLNEPANGEDGTADQDDGAGASAGPSDSGAPDVIGEHTNPSNTAAAAHSGARTGLMLSSEESGSDGEVQSTPEGFVPKTPCVGWFSTQ